MFNKTIFKQTLSANWKLWAIFSIVPAVIGAVIIAVFDPRMFGQMSSVIEEIPGIGEFVGGIIDQMSLLGMLGSSFYFLPGILLPTIYIIITANALVASQIDRGSMAYTLSTPLTRTKVVGTQAIFMIASVFGMFLVITAAGLISVQASHNGLWGDEYTPDVRAAAESLGLERDAVAADLSLILDDHDALIEGADARNIETDVYAAYLALKISEEAGAPAATALDLDPEQAAAMQERMMAGLNAAADELGAEAGELATDMGRIKNNHLALAAMVTESGLPEAAVIGIINQQLASDEMLYDAGIDFDLERYLLLNLGAFLLMFAMSGISFMFSCIFNLTKNSLALGAGFPVAFFIFEIMAQTSSDLEFFRYISLNSLFAPSEITGGGTFWPQFAALTALGLVLYAIGVKVFKEKDLPL